jgi:hypothetical protein
MMKLLKKTTVMILGIHTYFLVTMIFSSSDVVKKKQSPLTIHTIKSIEYKNTQQQTFKAIEPSLPAHPISRPPSPIRPSKPSKKKTTPAPPPPTPKKKNAPPKAKKQTSQIPQHLLRELEETIAKIDEKRDKLYSGKKLVSQKLQSLSDQTHTSIEQEAEKESVREHLIELLHRSLNLPDFGEVKIQLTLSCDGNIKNLNVLKTESEKNRKYLEENLPLLKFPSFTTNSEKETTFVITFCNEL